MPVGCRCQTLEFLLDYFQAQNPGVEFFRFEGLKNHALACASLRLIVPHPVEHAYKACETGAIYSYGDNVIKGGVLQITGVEAGRRGGRTSGVSEV